VSVPAVHPARKLGDLCEVITKGTTPTTLGFQYVPEGMPFVRATNLGEKFVDYRHDVLYIDSATDQALQRSRIAAGDVLLAIAGTIGRSSVVPDGSPRMNCNQAVCIIRPSPEVDRFYLKHWLGSADAVDQIKSSTVTGVISNLSLSQVRSLSMPLPSLPEQRRIAAILDKADGLRAKRREAIAKLDQLLQSVFLDMFGDPVTNPKGWPVRKLGDFGVLDRGVSKHRPRNAPELLGGVHPLIQTGDVARSNGYIRRFDATYSDAGLRQSKKWPAGTLCITIAANIASTGILTFDACFPDSVVGFTANANGNAEYVQHLIGFLKTMLEENAPQVAQKNINLAILRDLPVPAPPIELQRAWASIATRAEQQKQKGTIAGSSADRLFASLQRDAFSRRI